PSRSRQIDLFGFTFSFITNSRVDNEQTDCEKGRGNKRQLGKEELHLGVASMLSKEDFLNQELEREPDDPGCNGSGDDIDENPSECRPIAKIALSPGFPEIDDHSEHRSRVKHDEQEGHFRSRRI